MEKLELCYCPACGANDWVQIGNGICKCSYCGTKFQSNVLQSEIDLVSIIESQFGKQKLEMYHNSKAELWKATHEEYLSNENIKTWCNEVKKYSPSDALATFYSVATFGDVNTLCDYLCEYVSSNNYTYAEEIVRYIVKTAESDRLINPLVGIIEVAGLDGSYREQVNELSQKLDDGTFITSIPRDVFVLYSSKDISKVVEIVDYIEYNGFLCFYAGRNLRHGKGAVENYEKELQTAMHNSKVMVFISSVNSRRLDCDAMKVEIPYLKQYETEKKRFEYVVDGEKYEMTVPIVKRVLKEYFAGQEWCTNKDDLVSIIFDAVSGFSEELKNEEDSTELTQTIMTGEIESLLRRVFDFLGDEEWEKADDYCEKILDKDVENGEAYLGKLMAKLKVRKREELQDLNETIEGEKNYIKIEQYGKEELKKEVRGYNEEIKKNKEKERIREKIYQKALIKESRITSVEEYQEVIGLYSELNGYKDSKFRIEACERTIENIKNPYAIGRIIKFGRYPQEQSGEEKEIEWRILDNKNGELFLISEYGLDCKKYNEKLKRVTWETCTLRKWLNEEFYSKAFNQQEQRRILTTKVTADKNPNFSTKQGNDTNDKVFLLSAKEVTRYFKDNDSMIAKTTEYAKNKISTEKADETWWWLRSAGGFSDLVTIVYSSGGVCYGGYYVYDGRGAVRIALKIQL